MVARQRLTLYLLRDVSAPADALDPECKATPLQIEPSSELRGEFYWAARPPSTPAWVRYVSPALPDVPDRLKSSSASGLLVFQASGRFFAATFGYGRSFLNQAKVERQFGLRVALNTINPRELRSLDTKTFEDLVVARTTQASRSTTLPVFGIDVSRDILRAATGEPRDPRLGKRISGSDPIVLQLDGSVNDLPRLCADLLSAYSATEYKESFGWIDNLALVQDDVTIAALDEKLVSQLRRRDTTSTHLAMPDTLSWEDVDRFKITGARRKEYDDLDLDGYLSDLTDPDVASLSPTLLKSRRVSVSFTRSPSDWDSRWSLYHSLVSEQRSDGGLYVLIEGRWFEVSKTLADSVDSFVSGIPASGVSLLPAIVGEKEADYNTRLAAADKVSRVRLDAKILKPDGATSGLEFCDVLTNTGVLIHVKQKSRSSTLSHLFAQGVVSATALLGDGGFRERVRHKIREVGGDGESWDVVVPGADRRPDRTTYTVSYVVIANSTKTDHTWLPFFSRLNLMLQARTLENLGVSYTLDRVPIHAAP